MTSAFIFGQKRVGKTSVAKALGDRLSNSRSGHFEVIYLPSGDYVHPNATATIELLGARLCREVQNTGREFQDIPIPIFRGSLSPLTEFLDSVSRISPDRKFLFILDEFDELPMELYRRGGTGTGDAFFLALRTISAKPSFGFVLVGGELMSFVMNSQGDRLNKFQSMSVNYFDRDSNWIDFEELIRRPVSKWIEVSDEALIELYDLTAGNPYFAKLICRDLFQLMLERRDCHVTKSEVIEAAKKTLHSVDVNAFAHFWLDGIFENDSARVEDISLRRREVLLRLASIFRQGHEATQERIARQQVVRSVDNRTIARELHDFTTRGILIETNGSFECKVPFFRDYLSEYGMKEIATVIADTEAANAYLQEEESSYVHSTEIVSLVKRWGLYKGRVITEDQVRAWLIQFGDNAQQRLMFQLLEGVNFYSADRIREKLKEAYGIFSRGLTTRVEAGRRRRSNVLVSYLGGPGKSGSNYAKLFADENNIYVDNIVEYGEIRDALGTIDDLQALVFIDDFVGTGDSASEYLASLDHDLGDELRKANLIIHYIAVCGFTEGQKRIENSLLKTELEVSVNICELLDDADKCFSGTSNIFEDSNTRSEAMNIAHSRGVKLEKKHPLGYGDCEAAIVFEQSCPNNSLPILWAETKDWKPLFKRR